MNRKNLIILFSLFLTGITISAVTSVRADVYNVYNDAGIPADSEVWTWDGGGASYNGDYLDISAPEGSKSFKVVNNNWAGWGVFLIKPAEHTVNLSNYDSLKFWIKTSKTGTNLIKVEIQQTNSSGPKSTVYFSGSTVWQEITVSKSSFSGLDFSKIFSPFMVTMDSLGTFYIDDVRWTTLNSSPNPPSSLGPTQYVNGSWGSDNTPTLQFIQSDPDTLDILKYTIQIDNNSNFSSPEVNYTSGLLAQGVTSYTPSALVDGSYYWRVMSTDDKGAASSWIVANGGNVAFRIDTSKPSTPVVTDDGDYTSSTTQLHASWSASDSDSGIAEYQYGIGTTAGGTDVVGWTSAGINTSVTKTGLSLVNGETYYFTVKAKNGAGLWSDAGNSDGITVNTNVPASPQLVSPQDGSATNDTTPTFDWTDVSDPSGITYQIQVDNSGSSFPSPEINVSGLTSSTYTPTTALAAGTYWWRVKATNGVGIASGWSATWQLILDTTAPGNPGTPRDQGTIATSTTIEFEWTAASDPESGIEGYYLQVGTSLGGSDKFNDWVGNVLSKSISNCENGKTYYARVRAKNKAGIYGSYSNDSDGIKVDLTSYVTYNVYNDNGLPTGVTSIPVMPASGGPTLTEPNGLPGTPEGTKCLELEVGSAGWGGWWIELPSTENLSNYTGGKIRFWVRTAKDLVVKIKGGGVESGEKRITSYGYVLNNNWQQIEIPLSAFTGDGVNLGSMKIVYLISTYGSPGSGTTYYVDNVRWIGSNHAPNPPSSLGPTQYVNGSWGSDNTPTLQFTQSDPDTLDTLKYTIQIDNNSNFSSPEVNYTSGLLAQGVTSYTPSALVDGSYYWRVMSTDDKGAASSWTVANGGNVAFRIDTSKPSTPVVTDDGDYTSSTTQLHASWSASDSESGIAEYQYGIGTTAGGTDVVGWTSAGTNTSVTKTGLSLVNGETYYFTVKAKNGAGLWSDVGNSDGITVATSVPESPELVSPANGSATNDTTPTFDWTDVSDPSGITYQIQVDNSGSSFPSPEINVSGLTSSTYTPTTGLSDGTYWWRVKATNGVGIASGWSATWQLIIDTTAPGAPVLISPIDNDVTNDQTPHFDWSDVIDPNGVTYEIQVGIVSESGLTSSEYIPLTSLDYGTYTWKVRAEDGAGNTGNWSQTRTLTIANLLSYNVYTDAGLPYLPSPYRSDIYKWSAQGPDGYDLDPIESASDAPEGTEFLRATVPVGNTWAGWGVFFFNKDNPNDRYGKNLSDYAEGYLKFWVRTDINLKVEIQNTGGTKKVKYIQNYGWNQNFVWQEISIPIKDFTIDTNFLSNIYSPFSITVETDNEIFDVDNVRWVRRVEMPGATEVRVVGRQLFVDDNLFTVKGVCYSPTPVGEGHGYDWSSYPDNYGKDFALLRAMGCNTIKVYNQPTQIAVMDSAYLNGIYIIMDYSINWDEDVSDPATRESIKDGFLDMVNIWKDHPAVLMWNLGNGMNAHVSSLSDWYSLVNECAQAAHNVDPNHPVTTACQDVTGGIEGEIQSYDSSVPDMDIWSVQLYRGDSFGNLFTSFAGKSSKPLLLIEFGCDAYNGTIGSEDQDTQATYIDSQWAEIKNNLSSTNASNVSIGGCIFEWSDEWWKHSSGSNSFHDTATDWTNPNYSDPNMNEEWWGIVSVAPGTYHKGQRQAWYTLQTWWSTVPLLTVTLKKISDDTVPAEQLLTWKNVSPGVDIWKFADHYLQVDADTSFSSWGIQIYTDNRNLGGGTAPDPPYEGPEETDPCGLVATDDHTGRIPLCWKITDEVWTASSPPPEQGGPGPGPQDPVEVPDPTIPNAYYFSNNYLWMKDRGTPDDPETPKNLIDETFVDGEYYITVWDQDGIQWGGDPAEHGGGMSSPNYIYIGGEFINATTPRTYKTNKMSLEMYFP